VSQAGWIHGHGTRIWAASDMETFSTWSSEVFPFSSQIHSRIDIDADLPVAGHYAKHRRPWSVRPERWTNMGDGLCDWMS
jgi:hypothetical protein